MRDDDDVNIFVSKSGTLFAESPTFKQTLDEHLKQRLREASIALMQIGHDDVKEEEICDLALELVVKACSVPVEAETAAPTYAEPHAVEAPTHAPNQWQPQSASEQLYAQWATQTPIAPQQQAAEYSEHGIPIYRPQ